MFLNRLRPEAKELFLEAACGIAYADGRFAGEEKEILAAYAREMNVTMDGAQAPEDLHALVQRMAETMNPQEKKIAFFELVGLAMADGEYGADERKAMQELMKTFGMAEAFAQDCESMLKEYFVLQKRMTAAVLG